MRWLAWLADRLTSERFEITRRADGAPYLCRWCLWGSREDGSKPALYLHRFTGSDDAELHDHPFAYTSLIIAGGYYERTPADGWVNGVGPEKVRWYGPGRLLHRPATWIHGIVLPPGKECWTLMWRGVKVRGWGFWLAKCGFVPWRQHLANVMATGDGCGGGS